MQNSHSHPRGQLANSSQEEQEEDVITPNQDSESFRRSLPKDKGWWADYLYEYEGFRFEDWLLKGVLACHRHFVPQDTDVLLVTPPKSGTTWLKALTFAIANRKKHPPTQHHHHHHPLLTKNPHQLVLALENLYTESYDDPTKLPDLGTFSSPRIFSMHTPFSILPKSWLDASKCKLVYLCRDPKDVFTSLWHFRNSTKTWETSNSVTTLEEAFDFFCKGVSPFGPYWDHVLDYWKASCEMPDKLLFLRYEELKEQPVPQLKRLARFMQAPFSIDEEESGIVEEVLRLCSFDTLSSMEVNKSGHIVIREEFDGIPNKTYFRKGKVGDWINLLTPEMAHRLDHETQQRFQGAGLSF